MFFLLRKCSNEIENRLWSFVTWHQDDVHKRLKADGSTNTLGPDQVGIQCDFGSKRKKRTHRFMSLVENRNMVSYSTELHQKYTHIEDVSTPDDAKLSMSRHYILADDCTQDSSQAVCNKSSILKKTKEELPDTSSAIFMSDGGHQ